MAERIQDILLWARANRFRVRELQVDDVRIVLDDLGGPPVVEQRGAPSSIHAAWAEVLNVPYDEGEDTDPVEGQ